MKRILLVLALTIGISQTAQAAHFDCTPASGKCNGGPNGPCDWATAASWTSCNSTFPCNGSGASPCAAAANNGHVFTANITAGNAVMLSTDGITIGDASSAVVPLTVAGVLSWDSLTTNRDAQGFRTLTLLTNNAGNSGQSIVRSAGSVIRMRHGDRMAFDTSTGTPSVAGIISTSGTAVWDVQGAVTQTYVDSTVAATTNTLCDGGGGVAKQYITVTLHDYTPGAKVGRRILFQSGQLRTRQYEIVSFSGKTVGFCADLVDSAVDFTCDALAHNTCGQRLTAHRTFGFFPDATPTANTRHWTLTEDGDFAVCTAAFTPRAFCTGAATGTAVQIVPAAKDLVAIIDDAWIYQSAGSKGIYFLDSNITAQTNVPKFYATNWSGIAQISVQAPGTVGVYYTGRDVLYNNFHDIMDISAWNSGGIYFVSLSDWAFQWNAVHDGIATAVDALGLMIEANDAGVQRRAKIIDNVFYRLPGDAFVLNNAGALSIMQDNEIARNLVYEQCSKVDGAGGDCNGLEIDCSNNTLVHNNLIMDVLTNGGSPTGGFGIRFGGTGGSSSCQNGNVAYDNIIVNTFDGIRCDAQGGAKCQNTAAVRNYVSNTLNYGIDGMGSVYSNISRNIGVKGGGYFTIGLFKNAYSNFAICRDAALSAAGGNLCHAYLFGRDANIIAGSPAETMRDNILAINGATSALSGIFVDAAQNGTITIDHQTDDGGGATATISSIDFNGWAPTSVTVANVTDLLAAQLDAGFVGRCDSGTTNSHETYGSWFGGDSSVTAETTGSSGFSNAAGCFSTGTRLRYSFTGNESSIAPFIDRANLNFNIPADSPLATAGVGGTSMGSRAFKFNRAALDAVWGNSFPWDLCAGGTSATLCVWPKDISNGTCSGLANCNQDTDGDGVLDLHDNCTLTFNPSQYDGDGDGKGDVCDASP